MMKHQAEHYLNCSTTHVVNEIKKIQTNWMDINIYPNPTNNTFAIQFGNEIKNAEIKILNVLGETVLTKSINNSNNALLDASSFSNGIFFIQIIPKTITSTNQIFTQKLIKQ